MDFRPFVRLYRSVCIGTHRKAPSSRVCQCVLACPPPLLGHNAFCMSENAFLHRRNASSSASDIRGAQISCQGLSRRSPGSLLADPVPQGGAALGEP